MTVDIELGFKDKPEDLEVILKQKGFEHYHTLRDNDKIRAKIYILPSGICFTYHDNLGDDSFWPKVINDHSLGVDIIEQGALSVVGGDEDYEKALDVGKFLRDRYDAILYEPQKDEIITD